MREYTDEIKNGKGRKRYMYWLN